MICNLKYSKKIKQSFFLANDFYKIDKNIATIYKPEIIIKNLIRHFSIRSKEFKEFKKLENEIIHFKQIKMTEKKRKEIEERIQKVLKYKEKDNKLVEVAEKIQNEPHKALEYAKEIENITKTYVKESELQYEKEKIKFKYLPNHYYMPVVISENEKEIYFMHIIKNQSEVDFVNELEEYLQQENNFFKQFDWWYFSKLDETLDEVYLPYYQPKTNKMEKFKPDFIFWLKKDNNYTILFVDPKGTEHTDAYRKIDGFSRIFEEEINSQEQNRVFSYNGLTINVKLLLRLVIGDASIVPELYKRYWFENLDNFAKMLRS